LKVPPPIPSVISIPDPDVFVRRSHIEGQGLAPVFETIHFKGGTRESSDELIFRCRFQELGAPIHWETHQPVNPEELQKHCQSFYERASWSPFHWIHQPDWRTIHLHFPDSTTVWGFRREEVEFWRPESAQVLREFIDEPLSGRNWQLLKIGDHAHLPNELFEGDIFQFKTPPAMGYLLMSLLINNEAFHYRVRVSVDRPHEHVKRFLQWR
jgi:hypothetical protein